MDNIPSGINNEGDLDAFREYLSRENSGNNPNNTQIPIKPSAPQTGNMSYIPHENTQTPQSLKNTAFLPAFLSKHIGKLVKAESLMGDRLETKTGVLMTVGSGFMVLRQLRTGGTVIIELPSVKYITVIHDNDPRKLIP